MRFDPTVEVNCDTLTRLAAATTPDELKALALSTLLGE